MAYLAQSTIFETEKAFDTDFPVDHIPSARKTNHENDIRTINIYEVKDPKQWDLNVHGFCILQAETHLSSYDAFKNKEEAQKSYWYEIEALIHEHFPEYTRIESYDCTVWMYFVLRYMMTDITLYRLGEGTQNFQKMFSFTTLNTNSPQQGHTATDQKLVLSCNLNIRSLARRTFGKTKTLILSS